MGTIAMPRRAPFHFHLHRRPSRLQRIAGRRPRIAPLVMLTAAGMGAMYILDPRSGARRRALARDKVVKGYHLVSRGLPGVVGKRSRYLAGRLRGAGYALTQLRHPNGGEPVDDVTLAQRVRTELFRDRDFPDGNVNIDAHDGVVTMRGELPRPELIRETITRAQRIPGVREVRNLLHLPNTVAPNHPPHQ